MTEFSPVTPNSVHKEVGRAIVLFNWKRLIPLLFLGMFMEG